MAPQYVVLQEEASKCTEGTLLGRGPSTYARIAEIMSGRANSQQGLAVRLRRTKIWCIRVTPRHQKGIGLAHEPVRAMKKG